MFDDKEAKLNVQTSLRKLHTTQNKHMKIYMKLILQSNIKKSSSTSNNAFGRITNLEKFTKTFMKTRYLIKIGYIVNNENSDK